LDSKLEGISSCWYRGIQSNTIICI
jgi:hypothetical protein